MAAKSSGKSTPDIISNTTPLICLAGVGLLDVLEQLFTSIVVTEQVLAEYQAGMALDNRPALEQFSWISIASIALNPEFTSLDIGEASVLSYAVTMPNATVLLDDRLARKAAEKQGLRIIGTLGILGLAKENGFIPAAKPYVELLLHQGRYLSPALCQRFLTAIGE